MDDRKQHIFLLASFVAILVFTAIRPYNHLTWLLESSPAIIAMLVLVFTYKAFRLTPMLYWLIWLHGIILVIGGYYTYERVPLGFWLESIFETGRNNYDKIGHFAQGFIPAIAAREVLLRKNIVKKGAWLSFIVVCVVLAASAAYELIEFGASVTLGAAADDFLGTQGYAWDTQTDMLLALVGACLALLTLSSIHDRQLQQKH